MSDQQPPRAPSSTPNLPAPGSWLWGWIVPSFGKKKGWKHRARWVALRLVGYYAIIVVVIGLFQRRLIYLPQQADSIPPRAAGFASGQIHDVSFTTDDGLTLHGWHLLPGGIACDTSAECDAQLKEAERVVLYFPGNGYNRSVRASECRCFTDLGAHVFLFDYRGYGENPGSPSEALLASDARSVWEYAVRERGVLPARIIVYGESLGGAVATRLAAEHCLAKTPPGGLILCGTFSSLVDAGDAHYPWLPVRLLLIDRFPSVDRIGAVSCPVLHIHGDQDEIVPIDLARKLFAAVPEKSASGVPKQFIEVAGGGHNDFLNSPVQPSVRAFFERINGAR
jgi:uncharacterized protein